MAEMVRKSSVDEILNHWILAGSCILLMITGFAFLYHLEGVGAIFGGFNTMKTVHNWGGIVFSLSLLYSMRHYLMDALDYDADDGQWFKVAGGYLSHKVKVPPMGKYNPGQKLYYLAIVIAGIAIALSGFGIWLMKDNTTIMLLSHLVHNVAFIHLCSCRTGAYVSRHAGKSRHFPAHGHRNVAGRRGEEALSQMDEGCRQDVIAMIL